MVAKSELNIDAAQVIALKALAFLASDSERVERFMKLTGLAPAEIRAQAGTPAFLGGLLEYLRTDQTLLLAFTESEGLEPDIVDMACLRLTGIRE